MNFYCNSSIESIQSCGCRCRSACCCPFRCCKKHVATPMVKKRSRFGDIFKGQTPNLEELNYYRNKKQSKTNGIAGKGGKKKKNGLKGRKRGRKGSKRVKRTKGEGNGNGKIGQAGGARGKILVEGGGQGGDQVVAVGGIYDGGPIGGGGKWDTTLGEGHEGGIGGIYGIGGGATGGKYGTGIGGAEYGGAGHGGAGYGAAVNGGASYGVDGYSGAGHGGGGYGGAGNGLGRGQGGSAGDAGAYGQNKSQWRKHNECRPNQLVKCSHTCTLKPKKCMPNQIGPCNPECLRGIPYNEPIVPNYPGTDFGKRPFIYAGGGIYCAQGGLQGNYVQTHNVGFDSGNRNSPYQKFSNVPPTDPQYCSPQTQRLFHPGVQDLSYISQYCGPQSQESIYPGHQNCGNIPTYIPQYSCPQIQNGYGNMTYNMRPPPIPQYGVNPIGMYCQPGGLQGYMDNPLSQQQNYVVQQLQTISPNYPGVFQSTTSPQIISNYLQGNNQEACPAVHSITCKICGREKKFTQTLFVKPNVDSIFTTKDVKSTCSQTIS